MRLFLFFLLICLLVLAGCFSDAPRDNPLDGHQQPAAADLTGTVQTFYPHQPQSFLSGARITLRPGNRFAYSDAQGTFHFDNLPAGEYSLTCEAAGFLSDSATLQLPDQTSATFRLDGLPYLKSTGVTTHHISRWFPAQDLYYLGLHATAGDTDGVQELNRMEFEISHLGISDTLQQLTAGEFDFMLLPTDYGINSLHELSGHGIRFRIADNFGAQVNSEPVFLTRIIEETPILTEPVEWMVVPGPPFTMKWQTVYLPFIFTLKIEIYRIVSGFIIKVAEIGDIAGSASSYSYGNFLSAGDYFWALFIVDDFGNESRSKEGAFRVQ